MHESLAFGLLVLCASGAGLLAVQSHGLSRWLPIPPPALFLVAAAVCAEVVPGFSEPSHQLVERVVTLALIVILFDGGLHIGVKRMQSAAPAVASLGVLGTFATVAVAALAVHQIVGVPWYLSVLLATAIAPTDPAVVFSVLGQREVEGPSGTVLEGESGANDPVGIALMAALISAGSLSVGAAGEVAGTFALQMAVGAVVGVVGARLLLLGMRRVSLPAEGLHAVRSLLAAGAIFGVATVAHGSGFLAVFVAGVLLGDEPAPYKREIERFQSALASVAEIVAFAFLGFTVDLHTLAHTDVWVPGLVLGLILALVIRPLVGFPLLLRGGLNPGERAFVLLAGLKGAVPLLLGSMLLPLPGGDRLYGIVVVVVLFSVFVQAALVPLMAQWLKVEMRTVEQAPFALGVRLPRQPQGAHHLEVGLGAMADGSTPAALPDGTWVALIVRDGDPLPARSATVLRHGDEVLVLIDPTQDVAQIAELFAPANEI